MKLNQITILSLLISFHIIIGTKKINNFDEVIIEEGTTKFEYYYIKSNLEQGKNAYFFFTFNYKNSAKLTIKDGENNYSEIKKDYNDNCYYHNENLKSQKYTFIIECSKNDCYLNSNEALSMLFIDNSKEINTNLDNLSDLNFHTNEIMQHPLPLIFNLDSMEGRVTLYLDTNYDDDEFIDGDSKYMIEYCRIQNDGCKYYGINNPLILYKDYSYKIKYDCVRVNDYGYFYFRKFKIKDIFKEVGFGFHQYIINSRIYAIFLNARNINEFFLYLKPNTGDNLKVLFINDLKKIGLEEGSYSHIFLRDEPQYHLQEVNHIEKKGRDKDYFVVFNYDNDNYYKKGFVYFFNSFKEIQNEYSFEMGMGIYGLIKYITYSEDINQKYIIASSNKTMNIINSNFNKKELTNLVYLDNYDDYNDDQSIFIYVDSLKTNTTYKFFSYKESMYNNIKNLNLMTELSLTSYFKNYGPDSLFMRTTFSHLDYNYYTLFFFGLDEKYYLYIRKYFGNIGFYKYKRDLGVFSDIEVNYNEYALINSTLLIVSGFQIYSFYNSYGALYDLFFQKVNDLERIQINSEMYQFGNLVKLLKGNQTYYLDFKVDHLIILDKEFLDAEVIFTTKENNQFFLNKSNNAKLYLEGVDITVKTDKSALIYFYKRIDESKIKIIKFEENQKGKNMKFSIKNKQQNGNINILIIKDFSFEGYYPMLSNGSIIQVNNNGNNATIYVENLYDNLDIELYEEEKYYIYILDNSDSETIFSDKYLINDLIYIDNLLINPYNFQIIPPNTNGSIILSTKNKKIQYRLFTCQNDEIKFKIDLSNNEYPYENVINKYNENKIINFYLKENEILSHSFESEKELLFTYTLYYYGLFCDIKLDNFTIISIDEISSNLIKIEFSPIYINCLGQYYIFIAKNDNNNNIENFSNACYISNMILNNTQNLIIKTLRIKNNDELTPLISLIDISQLNIAKNDELVVTILGYNSFDLYKPKELKLENKNPIEFKIGEQVEFNFNKEKIFFKFEYNKHNNDLPQIIYFNFSQNIGFYILLINNKKTKMIELHGEEELINITLANSGTYYLEFYSYKGLQIEGKFISFIPDYLIDTIDLTQKMYSGNSTIKLKTNLGYNFYQVNNLTKDTFVYFIYSFQNENKKDFICPFVICNNKTCENNKTLFKFMQKYNYTIYINFINKQDNDIYYYYPSYVFFPIFEDTIEVKEEGFYSFREPKIYIVNLINKENLFLHYEYANQIYLSYSNDINIENSEHIIDNLNLLEISDLESISNKNGYNYGILLVIPFMNKYTTKFIIADLLIDNIDNIEEYTIPGGQNAIIFVKNSNLDNEDKQGYPKNDKDGFSYNILTTFSTEGKYMSLIGEDDENDINKKYDFIAQNSYPFPIYVEKFENDIIIKIKIYNSRYTLFTSINNNLFENYINFFLKKAISNKEQELFNFQQFPLYFRINSDYFNFNEFFNFYLYEPDFSICLKIFYGETDFYENNSDYIDKNDLSAITKPIYDSENNKTILNKILNLSGTKLIAGHLEHNSFFDLYIDLNDNNTDIEIIPFKQGMYKNTAKFIKKDIEYKLDFTANHLIKLETGFNANVTIYDNKGNNYILSPEDPTVEIHGSNFKIISNNDTMIFFYGKLFGNFKQYKIENEEGKNIEIKINSNMNFAIDFGFEGYFLNDYISLSFLTFSEGGTFYMENIYEKLKTNLIKGENLYLYYISSVVQEPFEINYSSNINNPKNEYTFNVISTNDKNKSLIINNYHYDEIIFQINFCSSTSSHNIKINYHSAEIYNRTIIELNNDKKEEIIHNLKKYPFKLTFESNEDFVFSYSFFDSGDSFYSKKEEWLSERIVNENLSINEFMNYLGIISISFNPNYKASSTRYIIIIAPLNEDNIIENYSYPCYITKLLTDKKEGIKIINKIDIGENDFINVNNIDIFNLLNYNKNNNSKFIIGIISQELRFDKKMNYYNPILFDQVMYEIEYEKNQVFDLDENFTFYDLKYEKQTQTNELFLLNYNLKYETEMRIKIISEINNEHFLYIYDKNGYIYFPFAQNGHYRIKFEKIPNNNLISTNNINAGVFTIISAENPFRIDIKKENLVFYEFNITRFENESVSLKLNIDSLDNDYTKKISIANIDMNNLNDIVLIQKNNEGYIPLNFPYYTFEKDITYNITINFAKKEGNIYTFEKANIIDFSSDNILKYSEENITNKPYNFSNIDDKFIIINWTNLESISITIIKNNATIFISDLSENQSKNISKEFQNLHFNNITDSNELNITKPLNSNYSVLYIELYINGTEIEFNAISNRKEKEDEEYKEDEEETKEDKEEEDKEEEDKESKEDEDKGGNEEEEDKGNKEDEEDNEYKEGEEDNNDKSDKGGISTLVIVLISIFGFIFIFVIIFFILRYFRKKNDIDFEIKTKTLDSELLFLDD